MKKRLVSLLLALALLVLPVLPAFAAEEDSYTYVALGDSITNGKATKLLIPLLTGTMREMNLQNLRTLRKGLENLDLTPEELKAALKLLDSGMEEICDQTRGQTVANVEQILQELRALNPDAQIILVGYYNPLPFLPTYGRHFRLLNRSVKALAQQYGADYVSIPYTSIANDGHPTVCGHKYIARQILKAVRK